MPAPQTPRTPRRSPSDNWSTHQSRLLLSPCLSPVFFKKMGIVARQCTNIRRPIEAAGSRRRTRPSTSARRQSAQLRCKCEGALRASERPAASHASAVPFARVATTVRGRGAAKSNSGADSKRPRVAPRALAHRCRVDVDDVLTKSPADRLRIAGLERRNDVPVVFQTAFNHARS